MLTILNAIALLITLSFAIVGLTVLLNLIFFPKLRPIESEPSMPLVSILIPARDEATIIGQTIQHLLAQTDPSYEIILLDDASEDATIDQALAAAAGGPRFQVIRGKPLPVGWLGKNWACHQLAAVARGELLIFTDADVRWESGALAALRHTMQQSQADLLTVWPTQLTESWAERLTVPLISLAILGYLPVLPVHYTRWPLFAAGNGQCLAFRREAYRMVGGHAAVYNQIVEDVALARRVKSKGLELRMVDGAGLIACRMYTDWPTVRAGFAKNILAGHGNSPLSLLVSTLWHGLLFIYPWLWFFWSGSGWALGLIVVGVAIRAVTAAFTRQRPLDALLMPLSVLLMTRIAAQSIWWHWRGGPWWKGRVISS